MRPRGFSLIEMLVVMVIIGILGALAFPQYRSAIAKNNRGPVRAELADMAAKQEAYRIGNRAYSANFTSLRLTTVANATTIYLNRGGVLSDSQVADSIYKIDLVNVAATNTTVCGSATTPFLLATAVKNQVGDKACAKFRLCYNGRKQAESSTGDTSAATYATCWG